MTHILESYHSAVTGRKRWRLIVAPSPDSVICWHSQHDRKSQATAELRRWKNQTAPSP